MKKSLIFFLLFFLGANIFANFKEDLSQSSLSITTLQKKEYLSRYDMARLLNFGLCQDCVIPNLRVQSDYTKKRLEKIQKSPGYNLDDIETTEVLYEGINYFYCIAEVAEKGYMYGFPRETSPFCYGRFCGSHLARYSEVIEAIYRVARPILYKNYTINRKQVGEWIKDQKNDIPIHWFGLVKRGLDFCGEKECALMSEEQLDIYVKYCTQNDCGLSIYDVFPSGTRLSILFSLLVEARIIDLYDAKKYTMHSFLSPSVFLNYIGKITTLQKCVIDNDYDADDIKNKNDNCSDIYNKNQKDLDKDGIGNVCDDDIDGDGIKNPIGIVDDEDIIVSRLRQKNQDNCLFVENEGQENVDKNIYGDACDPTDEESMLALAIHSDPYIGKAPLRVQFSEEYVGNLHTLTRDFDDGKGWRGLNPTHTYEQGGSYVVTAKAEMKGGKIIVAKLPIEVLPGGDIEVGCAGSVDKFIGLKNDFFSFSVDYAGDVEKVTWSIEGQIFSKLSDEVLIHQFKDIGKQRIEMQCYNKNGERVGLSRLLIEVKKTENPGKARGAYLEASLLDPFIGEDVFFQTIYDGFGLENIDTVFRDFGDGEIRETKTLKLEKSYKNSGSYIVRQVISFVDTGEVLENILNVYVKKRNEAKSTLLRGGALTGKVGDIFYFDLELININDNEVSLLQRDCDNNQIIQSSNNIFSSLSHTCQYTFPGNKRIKAYLYTKDKKIFVNEMTIYVIGENICLESSEELHCDLDKDGIPDVCDDDIDGDGIKNMMGLILYETDDCVFQDNLNEAKNDAYHDACKGGADFDNCPFMKNSDQIDSDIDGYGAVCKDEKKSDNNNSNNNNNNNNEDNTNGGTKNGDKKNNKIDGDDDNDGIANESDACPSIPESVNGSEDSDGCPESPEDNTTNQSNTFVEAKKCVTCPCPYADYGSALRKGDRVRALLLDPEETVIYRYTKPEIINKNILDEMFGGG